MQVLGWVLTVAGVVLFPLPGPGLLLLAAGLAILAEHYTWAEKRVDRVKLQALYSAAAGVRTPWRTFWTTLVTAALGASGVLWLWEPAQPAWWVLPHWTWLPGGLWSGIGQIVSGLVALALVYYAWRRFHDDPQAMAELRAQLKGEAGADRGRPRCDA
jgi:acetamidase/formamidase